MAVVFPFQEKLFRPFFGDCHFHHYHKAIEGEDGPRILLANRVSTNAVLQSRVGHFHHKDIVVENYEKHSYYF